MSEKFFSIIAETKLEEDKNFRWCQHGVRTVI